MTNSLFSLRTLPALTAAALLAGCSLTPNYERPAAPVSTQWPINPPAATGAAAAELDWQIGRAHV